MITLRDKYCARPPFALEQLHQHDAEHLVYDIAKPRPDEPRALVLTPLELIHRIAALVTRPRSHHTPLICIDLSSLHRTKSLNHRTVRG